MVTTNSGSYRNKTLACVTQGGNQFSKADWEKYIKQGLKDKRFIEEIEPETKILNTTTVI